MAARALRADLARYAPAGLLTGPNAISTTDQDSALETAGDIADGYLTQRYTLPLVASGDDLKRAECALAIYDLLGRRNYNPTGNPLDAYRMRHDDALRWLADVRAGRITPSGIVDSSVAVSGSAPYMVTSTSRGW